MEQTSFYTYIKLAGNDDFPLEEVTKRLQIEPTDVWRVGDKVRPDRPLERFYTCWKYKVGPVASFDVDDVLELPVPGAHTIHTQFPIENTDMVEISWSNRAVVIN